ncbi:hypothetical protein SCA03_35730 [Streptomyces cacaoi]|uniref:Uncharacterized protein n=1 Tax=Streptomyces cacaoi TaxID=1898 RepID=A0A4Y3R0L3_STRCI|nr:hypothetical protein SCA03_35730 [Streptomyces cacaoi]
MLGPSTFGVASVVASIAVTSWRRPMRKSYPPANAPGSTQDSLLKVEQAPPSEGQPRGVRTPAPARNLGPGTRTTPAAFKGVDRRLLVRRPVVRTDPCDTTGRSTPSPGPHHMCTRTGPRARRTPHR